MSDFMSSLPLLSIPAHLGQVHAQEGSPLQWFAVHTRSRHENVVAQQLRGQEIEHLLPVYSSVRRWKDRTKQLTLPLFPGYLFVRIHKSQSLRVLELPGVARLVGSPKPHPLADREVDQIQQWSLFPHLVEPHPYLRVGQRVRVCRGPMADLDGVLLRKKSTLRLVVSIELIQRAVAVEIDAADIAPA